MIDPLSRGRWPNQPKPVKPQTGLPSKAEQEKALVDRYEQVGYLSNLSSQPMGKLAGEVDLLRWRKPLKPRRLEQAEETPALPEPEEGREPPPTRTQRPRSAPAQVGRQGFLPSSPGPPPAQPRTDDLRDEVRKFLRGFSPELVSYLRDAGVKVLLGDYAELGYKADERTVEVPEKDLDLDGLLEQLARAFDHVLGGDGFASASSLAISAAKGASQESNGDFFARSAVRYFRDPEELKRANPAMFDYLEHLRAHLH